MTDNAAASPMRPLPRLIRAVAIATVMASLGACALTRSEIDVPRSPAPAQVQSNRSAGKSAQKRAVIRSVKDARTFEASPSDPATPSLKDGNLQDTGLQARAVARKTNGFGKPLGEVVLKDGETVEGLFRNELADALAAKGYTVVDEPRNGAANVLILDLDVRQFWTWTETGWTSVEVTTRLDTLLDMRQGSRGAERQVPINASLADSYFLVNNGRMSAHIAKSLRAWRQQVEKNLPDKAPVR